MQCSWNSWTKNTSEYCHQEENIIKTLPDLTLKATNTFLGPKEVEKLDTISNGWGDHLEYFIVDSTRDPLRHRP